MWMLSFSKDYLTTLLLHMTIIMMVFIDCTRRTITPEQPDVSHGLLILIYTCSSYATSTIWFHCYPPTHSVTSWRNCPLCVCVHDTQHMFDYCRKVHRTVLTTLHRCHCAIVCLANRKATAAVELQSMVCRRHRRRVWALLVRKRKGESTLYSAPWTLTDLGWHTLEGWMNEHVMQSLHTLLCVTFLCVTFTCMCVCVCEISSTFYKQD